MDDVLDKLTEPSNIFTSVRGLQLRLKPVSRYLITEAGQSIKMPTVPQVWNDDKQRMEENPLHPDYIEAIQQAQYQRGLTTVHAYLALGTEVIHRPDDVHPPDSEEWSRDLAWLGVIVPAAGRARYVAWLKLYALNDEDLDKLAMEAMRRGGATLEADAVEAASSFRGDEAWDTNPRLRLAKKG